MTLSALLIVVMCVMVLGCAPGAMEKHEASSKTDDAGSEGGQVVKSDAEWRKELTPEQYAVLREKGTERAFTGEYDHTFKPGTYACAACGNELFTSETKFNSGCGWPAFYAAKAGDRVKLHTDLSHGMKRVEVTCARCGSHLGHIFDDAPDQPTGQRYCINSVSLKFIPAR
jgi:peptide-methionine (R)-S-oxide reductase